MPDPPATPGDDPSSASRAEVEGWIRMYEELLRFEQEMVDTMKQRVERLSPPAREEVVRTDLSGLEADLRLYQARLEAWRARLEDLDQSEERREA